MKVKFNANSEKINAHSLRMGNLLMKCGRLSYMDSDDLCLLYRAELIGISSGYEPIPIEDKHLRTFGFSFDVINKFHYKGNFNLHLSSELDCDFEYRLTYDVLKIKYIHELQNLYFVLTRQQLYIKNKD